MKTLKELLVSDEYCGVDLDGKVSVLKRYFSDIRMDIPNGGDAGKRILFDCYYGKPVEDLTREELIESCYRNFEIHQSKEKAWKSSEDIYMTAISNLK